VIRKTQGAHCFVVVVWWNGKWHFYSVPARFLNILLSVMMDGHEVALCLTDWRSNKTTISLKYYCRHQPCCAFAVPQLHEI
jgi:hypothetical protein